MFMAAIGRGTPIYQDQAIERNNSLLRHIVYACAAVIALLAAGNVWQAVKPASPPYVLTVDAQGIPLARLQPMPGTSAVTDQTIRYAIDEYIEHAFAVSKDFGEEQVWLSKVYAMSGKQAGGALTAWYKGHNPLTDGGKGWQECEVTRTLKYPDKDVYEVDYRTSHYVNNQDAPAVTNWRAFVKVTMGIPSDANPLGIWVMNIDFEPEAK